MRVKNFPYSWLRKQEQGEANKSLFVLILYTLGTLYNSRFDYWMPLCTRGVLDSDHECLNPSQAFTWPAAQKSFSSCQELDINITLTYNAVCGDDVMRAFSWVPTNAKSFSQDAHQSATQHKYHQCYKRNTFRVINAFWEYPITHVENHTAIHHWSESYP
jgi:hypothetical protein